MIPKENVWFEFDTGAVTSKGHQLMAVATLKGLNVAAVALVPDRFASLPMESLSDEQIIRLLVNVDRDRYEAEARRKLQARVDAIAAYATRPPQPEMICVAVHVESGVVSDCGLFVTEQAAYEYLRSLVPEYLEEAVAGLPDDEAVEHANDDGEHTFHVEWLDTPEALT